MNFLDLVVWSFTEKKKWDKCQRSLGVNPWFNPSPPSWSLQPKFPSLCKCNFHQFCLVIESFLLPPSILLASLQERRGSLFFITYVVLFLGPICGAGQQNFFGSWTLRCLRAFSHRRAMLCVFSVLLAFFQVSSFAFSLNPPNVLGSTIDSQGCSWTTHGQFHGFVYNLLNVMPPYLTHEMV